MCPLVFCSIPSLRCLPSRLPDSCPPTPYRALCPFFFLCHAIPVKCSANFARIRFPQNFAKFPSCRSTLLLRFSAPLCSWSYLRPLFLFRCIIRIVPHHFTSLRTLFACINNVSFAPSYHAMIGKIARNIRSVKSTQSRQFRNGFPPSAFLVFLFRFDFL